MIGIAESHGSFWVRDRLIDVDSIACLFSAKNRDSDVLPAEICVKSVYISFSHPLQFEKGLLCNLNGACRNILRCYGDEITTTKSGNEIYNVLLEYCSGSSLLEHIAKFGPDGLPEDEVRRYTRDIVRGLYYLHCNARYIHCNISSRSIFLSPAGTGTAGFVAKIGNLESAKELTSQVPDFDLRGSYIYRSPEACKGYLDWPADIWALGCVVSEMLTGTSITVTGDFEFRWDRDEPPKIPNEISKAGKDFLRSFFAGLLLVQKLKLLKVELRKWNKKMKIYHRLGV